MKEKKSEKVKKHSPWMALVTVMVGTLLIGLDRTVVNLGMPKMIADFGISVSMAGWIATSYIITNAVFVPVFGKLGDMIGDRKIYLWSFIGFIITSVLAGLSWNISSMIFFRALQGLVGAAVYPTAMSLIVKNFSDQKSRAQALGIWTASFAASAVFGPLVGGPLIDLYSWRMLFYINLPIGILGIFMVLMYLPNDRGKEKKGFDIYGAITLAIALSSLVLVLEKGREWEWTSLTSVLFYILVLVFGTWFVKIEKKHPSPMVDLKFFKNETFVSALLVSFISFGGMMGAMFLLPIFVQTYLGYDATQTGFLFLPMALTMFVAAPIGAKLAQKIHVRYSVSLGMFLVAFAIYLMTGLDAKTVSSELTIPLMMLAVVFSILCEGTVYGNTIARKPFQDTIGTAVGVAANIAVCAVLVPRFGVMGAAVGLVAANATMFLYRTVTGQYYYRTIPSFSRTICGFLLAVGVAVIGVVFAHNFIIKFVLTAAILFIYCNIYRAQLYKLWQIFMGFVRRYLLHSQA